MSGDLSVQGKYGRSGVNSLDSKGPAHLEGVPSTEKVSKISSQIFSCIATLTEGLSAGERDGVADGLQKLARGKPELEKILMSLKPAIKNIYRKCGEMDSIKYGIHGGSVTVSKFQEASKARDLNDVVAVLEFFEDIEENEDWMVTVPEGIAPESGSMTPIVQEKKISLREIKELAGPLTEEKKKRIEELKSEIKSLILIAQQLGGSKDQKVKVKSKDPVVADDAKGPIIQHAHPRSATASPSGQTDRKPEIQSSDNSRVKQKAVKNMGKRAARAREAVREGAEKVEKREVELERDKKIDTKIKKD